MLPVNIRFLLLAAISVSALLAEDPFVGKWKLNLAKSKLTGQTIEIEQVPGSGYRFKEDEHSDIILVDGLDHLTHFGDTMAITQNQPDTWAITYKRDGRVVTETTWKVSKDGKTLTYTAAGTRPNGQHFTNQMTAKRTGGGPGLAGTWETTAVALSSPLEIYIEPYDSTGQVVTFPGRNQVVRMKFDGKDYPDEGPTVVEGATTSGSRISDKVIETTEKIRGRVIETAKATISDDGSTQTIVITEPGDKNQSVLVYDRETASGKSK